MGNDLLTAQEVADILKVKKNTVYEMIKRGEIPSNKIGKQLRIARKDIESLYVGELPASAPALVTQPMVPATKTVNSIVLCGQDVSLDMIANYFSSVPGMPNILRSHAGSYNSLYQLYHGKADIATTHLWEEETGEYNISYIKKLVPGLKLISVRLFGRMIGLYVRKGNPKNIKSFLDFKRSDITIINREKGSGTRVLLDEKLKSLGILPRLVNGYENEVTSHLSVASSVARGAAHAGVGIERGAAQVKEIEFIPIQKEWYDMVFLADQADDAPYRAILDYVSSEKFMMEIAQIGDYDFSQTGRIIKL